MLLNKVILAPQACSEHPKLCSGACEDLSLYGALETLCSSPGVRGKVGMRILLNSKSKHANSTSITKLVICPVPYLLGRGACLHSSWSHRQAARARLAGDWWVAVGMWQASRYQWPQYLWKHKLSRRGAPAFAEAVLFSGKCCLQFFFSCSELSWATSASFAAVLVRFCSLGREISLNG